MMNLPRRPAGGQRRGTTAGEGAALRLATERTRLQADGADVAVVDVSVLDPQGRRVPTASNGLRFAVSGPVRLIGMGNGDPASLEAYKPAPRLHFHALRAWSLRGAPDETSAMADGNAGWRNPLEWRPADKAPPESRFSRLRASFARPPALAGERMELLVKELAPGQRLLVNGQAVAPRHDGEQWIVELDATALRDDNMLELVLATPARGMRALAHEADGHPRRPMAAPALQWPCAGGSCSRPGSPARPRSPPRATSCRASRSGSKPAEPKQEMTR